MTISPECLTKDLLEENFSLESNPSLAASIKNSIGDTEIKTKPKTNNKAAFDANSDFDAMDTDNDWLEASHTVTQSVTEGIADEIITRIFLDDENNEINPTSQVKDAAVRLDASDNSPSNAKQYKKQYSKPTEITQNELDRLLAKKSLGDFMMSRRKTLVTLPDVDYKDRNGICRAKCQNRRLKIYEDSMDIDVSRHKNLLDVLTNQMDIVEKLVDHLNQTKLVGSQRRSEHQEFDELLESLKTKRTKVTASTDAEKKTTQEMSTIMSLIDETVIRRVLKKDPLVSRILNKAKRRREKYFKEMQIN
ncbi:unnamed protein product [Parnassius apollo]|uniref:(apollo) hypothetical protein n=1 Tax=Parnassius apollo TaxID=110799 RepID=A0A8S3X648_PARAO|nr:unnamed protein product [Parnassius apollo]